MLEIENIEMLKKYVKIEKIFSYACIENIVYEYKKDRMELCIILPSNEMSNDRRICLTIEFLLIEDVSINISDDNTVIDDSIIIDMESKSKILFFSNKIELLNIICKKVNVLNIYLLEK